MFFSFFFFLPISPRKSQSMTPLKTIRPLFKARPDLPSILPKCSSGIWTSNNLIHFLKHWIYLNKNVKTLMPVEIAPLPQAGITLSWAANRSNPAEPDVALHGIFAPDILFWNSIVLIWKKHKLLTKKMLIVCLGLFINCRQMLLQIIINILFVLIRKCFLIRINIWCNTTVWCMSHFIMLFHTSNFNVFVKTTLFHARIKSTIFTSQIDYFIK